MSSSTRTTSPRSGTCTKRPERPARPRKLEIVLNLATRHKVDVELDGADGSENERARTSRCDGLGEVPGWRLGARAAADAAGAAGAGQDVADVHIVTP